MQKKSTLITKGQSNSMKIFDLHCDTAYEMYKRKADLSSNELCTNFEGFSKYSSPVQIFAIWSDNKKDENEVYEDFFRIYENFRNEVNSNSDKIMLCTDKATLLSNDKRIKAIISIEGSRLLSNDMARLYILRDMGVRVLTFAWAGICASCGAHDTETGLSEFGISLLSECEKLGITVDVSHLSEKGFWDIAAKATRPYIASHSNSATLCSHTRNLSDIQFRTLISAGGIVGMNLYPKFLSSKFSGSDVQASPDEIIEVLCNHIIHFLSLGGEKNIALGADRDGIPKIDGYTGLDCAYKISDRLLQRGVSEKIIQDIFYNNALNFFTCSF